MKVDLIHDIDRPVTFVTMTKAEALRTIESLAHQLFTENPNSGRHETFDQKGRSFTIAVIDCTGNHEQQCCKAHDTHSMPHVGCVMR